jgi:hypothetical protein
VGRATLSQLLVEIATQPNRLEDTTTTRTAADKAIKNETGFAKRGKHRRRFGHKTRTIAEAAPRATPKRRRAPKHVFWEETRGQATPTLRHRCSDIRREAPSHASPASFAR